MKKFQTKKPSDPERTSKPQNRSERLLNSANRSDDGSFEESATGRGLVGRYDPRIDSARTSMYC